MFFLLQRMLLLPLPCPKQRALHASIHLEEAEKKNPEKALLLFSGFCVEITSLAVCRRSVSLFPSRNLTVPVSYAGPVCQVWRKQAT